MLIMKRFCKVFVTLNKYKGSLCNSIQDEEYTFEVEWSGQTDGYNNGSFTLFSYHNGEQCDLEFNGWCFSCVNQGGYHFPGSYGSVDIDIECIDPNGEVVVVRDFTGKTSDFLTEGAALYMNRIMLVCLFKDKKEYLSFEHLQKNYTDCTADKSTLKKILKELSEFKEVIKRNEGRTELPAHFIENAKREYKRIASYVKENVDVEFLFDALFD